MKITFTSLFTIFIILVTPHVYSKGEVTIILTNNIEGKFSIDPQSSNNNSKILHLAKAIHKETINKNKIYIDLGNAFYPGLLSKFSYGSIMMDFFNFTGCKATLISSKDMQLGISSLSFLNKKSNTKLLSANILKNNKQVFTPYFIHSYGNKKIAFIGLSSTDVLFDVAEKNIYKLKLNNTVKTVKAIIKKLKKLKKISNIIVLSSLKFNENIVLLKKIKDIEIIISGGDNDGKLLGLPIPLITTADNRYIFSLSNSPGYATLQLKIGNSAKIINYSYNKIKKHTVASQAFNFFKNRVNRWKILFQKENNIHILHKSNKKNISLLDFNNLIKDVFNAEIAILNKNAVESFKINKKIKLYEAIKAVQDNYSIFTFTLKGTDVLQLPNICKTEEISGIKNKKIQGKDIDSAQLYKIVTTQAIHEKVQDFLMKKVSYKNNWKTLTQVLVEDLKGEKKLLQESYSYLDKRFRTTLHLFLSTLYEEAVIYSNKSTTTPAGNPAVSFEKLGLESKIDLVVYNSLHTFSFSPYIYYIKENQIYLQNLLKGTFNYNLNLHQNIQPYHKSQIESVVTVTTDKKRPTMIRETIGANFLYEIFSGHIGVGFEKQIWDNVDKPAYGIEALISFSYKFLSYFTYSFKFDSFFQIKAVEDSSDSKNLIRAELSNSLSCRITENIKFSLNYKYFHFKSKYNENQLNQRFLNSHFTASIDFNTDLKFY